LEQSFEEVLRYRRKCQALGSLAQRGNLAALNYLLEGVPHQQAFAFTEWVHITKHPSAPLEALLYDPRLRVDHLALRAETSAFASLVLGQLARLGNAFAKSHLNTLGET
jgi:hypothetical protein